MISAAQRARMLHSAAAIVSEHGYGQMSVARITDRARVSRRTFYDVFEDREDCFLAVFDDTVAQVSELVAGAYQRGEQDWRRQVRAALTALLVFLDERPEVASLLVVDVLGAGPRVLARRAEILVGLGRALDQGGSQAKGAEGPPGLTGEGVVGAVFSVLHTRLLAKRPGRLVELLNPLMGMIVLPYLGGTMAQRELRRPVPVVARAPGAHKRKDGRSASGSSSSRSSSMGDPLAGLPMRITYRTLRVVGVIGEHPGASNREVADLAGVLDQGQMSKLLTRLEKLGLAENATAVGRARPPRRGDRQQSSGEPNAWRLTARGEEVARATRIATARDGSDGRRGKEVA